MDTENLVTKHLPEYVATSRSGLQYPIRMDSERTFSLESELPALITIDGAEYPCWITIFNGEAKAKVNTKEAVTALGFAPPATVYIQLDRDFRVDFQWPGAQWAYQPEQIETLTQLNYPLQVLGIRSEYDQGVLDLLKLFISRCNILDDKTYNHLTDYMAEGAVCTHITPKPLDYGPFDAARIAICHYFFGSGGNTSHQLIGEKIVLPGGLGLAYKEGLEERHRALFMNHSYYYGKERGVIGSLYVEPSIWNQQALGLPQAYVIENGGMSGGGDGDTWLTKGMNLQYLFDPQRDQDLLEAVLGSIQKPVDVTINMSEHIDQKNRAEYQNFLKLFAPLGQPGDAEPMTYEDWLIQNQKDTAHLGIKRHSPVWKPWYDKRATLANSGIDFEPLKPPTPKTESEVDELVIRCSYSVSHLTLYFGVKWLGKSEVETLFAFVSGESPQTFETYWLKNLRDFQRSSNCYLTHH